MPQEEGPQIKYIPEDHPWLEIPEDSMDETLRYSLDEIRLG